MRTLSPNQRRVAGNLYHNRRYADKWEYWLRRFPSDITLRNMLKAGLILRVIEDGSNRIVLTPLGRARYEEHVRAVEIWQSRRGW